MGTYSSLLYFVLFCALLSFFVKKKIGNVLFVIGAMLVLLVVALRDSSIGTDTSTYCYLFLHPNSDYKGISQNVVFWFYNGIVRIFTTNPDCYIAITAVCCMIPVFYVIWKDSHNKCFSLFIFLTMGTTILFYSLYMAAMRHCLAVGCLFLLVYYVRNRKIQSFYVILLFNVIIAMIHITALFYLPFFMIRNLNFNKWVIAPVLVGSLLIGMSIGSYAQYLDLLDATTGGRFDYYLNNLSTSYGIMTTLPLLLLALMLTLVSNVEFRKDLYYRLFVTGVVLNNIMVLAANSSRLSYMFLLCSCVIIPNFIYEVMAKKSLKIVRIGLVFAVFFYYSMKFVNTWKIMGDFDNGNYIPYKTNSLV